MKCQQLNPERTKSRVLLQPASPAAELAGPHRTARGQARRTTPPASSAPRGGRQLGKSPVASGVWNTSCGRTTSKHLPQCRSSLTPPLRGRYFPQRLQAGSSSPTRPRQEPAGGSSRDPRSAAPRQPQQTQRCSAWESALRSSQRSVAAITPPAVQTQCLLFCEGCQKPTGFNRDLFYSTPWKSSWAQKNAVHAGPSLWASGGGAAAGPAQRPGSHAHVGLYACKTEPRTPNATASSRRSRPGDTPTARPPRGAAARPLRPPAPRHGRDPGFGRAQPRASQGTAAARSRREATQVAQAARPFNWAGKKATLARNARGLRRACFYLKCSNLVEEPAAVCTASMLTHAWLSQEIQESGQLQSIPKNPFLLPFAHCHAAPTQSDWHRRFRNRDPDRHIQGFLTQQDMAWSLRRERAFKHEETRS